MALQASWDVLSLEGKIANHVQSITHNTKQAATNVCELSFFQNYANWRM